MNKALHGIMVSLIASGWIPMEQRKGDRWADKYARPSTIPMGRCGGSEKVGWSAAHLASDEASFVTGQTIAVSGGKMVW